MRERRHFALDGEIPPSDGEGNCISCIPGVRPEGSTRPGSDPLVASCKDADGHGE